MITLEINNNSDWNIMISDPTVIKEGWWKLSESYKEWYGKALLRVEWNIVLKEDLFLEFIYYITDLRFKKIEHNKFQAEEK